MARIRSSSTSGASKGSGASAGALLFGFRSFRLRRSLPLLRRRLLRRLSDSESEESLLLDRPLRRLGGLSGEASESSSYRPPASTSNSLRVLAGWERLALSSSSRSGSAWGLAGWVALLDGPAWLCTASCPSSFRIHTTRGSAPWRLRCLMFMYMCCSHSQIMPDLCHEGGAVVHNAARWSLC